MTLPRIRDHAWDALWLVGFLLLVGLAWRVKFRQYAAEPCFDRADDIGLFASEGAVQYRYARMVAAGERIPDVDRAMQWPEGLRPWREMTILMEPAIGLAYRLAGRPGPFHLFAIQAICAWTGLALAAVALAGFALGLRRGHVLAAVAIYALAGASFDRIRSFEYEYFALPLIFISCAAFWRASSGQGHARVRQAWGILSALAIMLALCSWHMTSFLLWAWLGALAGAFVLAGAEGSTSVRALRAAHVAWLSGILAAPCLSPALRYTGFWSSPQVVFGLLLSGVLWLPGGMGMRKRLTFSTMALAIAIGLGAGLAGGTRELGHAWPLLHAKLATLGIKPADPADIPFAARVMWYPGFDTLSPAYAIFGYGLALPLGLAGAWSLGRRHRRISPGPPGASSHLVILHFLLFAVATLALAVFLCRLGVVAIFPLSLLAGFACQALGDRGFAGRALAVAAVLAHVGIGLAYEDNPLRRAALRIFPRPQPLVACHSNLDKLDLLRFVREQAPPVAVFLSNIETSPDLVLYARRAVNLQPKFESSVMRAKFAVALDALFGDDEAVLHDLCRQWGTTHLFLPAQLLVDASPDSYRYLADRLDISPACLVWRFHFRPEGLEHFRPVFRNAYGQVFRMVEDVGGESRPALDGHPLYDERVFAEAGGAGGTALAQSAPRVLRRIILADRLLDQAAAALAASRPGLAAAHARAAFQDALPDLPMHLRLARILMQCGDAVAATQAAEAACRLSPASALAWAMLAQVHLGNGRHGMAAQTAERALALDPRQDEAMVVLGLVALHAGHRDEAIAWLGQALAVNPAHPVARDVLGELSPGHRSLLPEFLPMK